MAIKHFLTIRETELMDLLVIEELSPHQVAERWCISKTTVRFHITNVLERYHTNSITVACIRYLKETHEDDKQRALIKQNLDKE